MQPTKPLTLRRNFSWTFVGNIVYAGCQWGMLMILAKLGSPEMVGQFTLGLAVTAPLIMFAELQLRLVQATDAKRQYIFADYLGLRLLGIGLAIITIALIAFSVGYRLETSVVILLVGLAKGIESISNVFHGLIQQHERMDRIAISLMIKGPLSLLLLAVGVHIFGNLVLGVAGLVLAWAVVLVGFDIRNGASFLKQIPKPRWHWKTLKMLVWLTLPLGLVRLLISLNLNIPRYLIEQYLGERELGIFSAIAYLMMVGNIILNALGESASPKLAQYYAVGDFINFRKLLLKLEGLAAFIGVGSILVAVFAGKEILTLLYQPEYAKHQDLFVWLMIAAAINYMSYFLRYGMTAARYFRVQMFLFFAVASTSAVVCLWLLPKLGLIGAAIGLINGGIVEVIFCLGVIAHALQKPNKG